MTATTDEREEVDVDEDAPPARRRIPWEVLVVLLLVVLTVFLGFRLHQAGDRSDQRDAAVAAASDEVQQLWTISSLSSDQVLKRLMDGATGSFKAQLGQQSGSFQQVLRQQGVSATGSVVQSGLVSLTEKKATVLVAVDARIASAMGQAQTRQYRMQVHLQRSANRWLVADLGFVS